MSDETSTGSGDDEIWYGAAAIGNGIAPKGDRLSPRQVYWLHESRQIPSFKIGRTICLRPKTWRKRLTRLEQEASAGTEMQQSALPSGGAAAADGIDEDAWTGTPPDTLPRRRLQAPDVPPNWWRLGTIIAELPFLARAST